MTEQTPDASTAAEIANELSRCRQRGLDDLDASMSNQPPVEAPALEHLATEYQVAKQLEVYGRAAQIRALLRDGLSAYAELGNEPESRFVGSLFFDPSGSTPTKEPSELLADAMAATGLDQRRFADYRRSAFRRFAEFLIRFVQQTTAGAEAQQTVMPPPAPRWRRSPILWVGAGVAGLVVIGAILAAVLLISHPRTPEASATHSPSATSTPSVTASPYAPGKTYTEETGQYGTPTFTDPHNPSVSGKRVPPYQHVQVSCKMFSPTIPSVSPDGYWYRIASSPWNGKYYGVANTFLNGDKVGGPSLHNTDFKVPNCPEL